MSSVPSPTGVVSFEEARRIVERHAVELAAHADSAAAETVALTDALGRVLAEPLIADRDFPPFDRATRDGFAVRAADVEHVPARLEVIAEIKAGDHTCSAYHGATYSRSADSGVAACSDSTGIALNRGQAVSIMTGAPLPPGADAVVMVEYTTADGKSVEIQRNVASGENFVRKGAEALAGQLLVERGCRLDHSLIAIAAAVGKTKIDVYPKPRVVILSTGDEVVEIDRTPGPAQIRNSNSYSLAAQIENVGGAPVRLPIAPDEPTRLRELIMEGLKSDLLLITGGVSMGKYDLVEQVLGELKARFYFTGARIQPGKPIVFGSCSEGSWGTGSHGTELCGAGAPARVSAAGKHSAGTRMSTPHYFFGLPGNPVSTMVTFWLFAEPLIAALSGRKPEPLIFLKARLKSEIRTKTGLTRFLPAIISGEFENVEVELAAWHGSGDIAALAHANCYLVIPPDRERIEAGEWVSVLMP